MSTFCHGYVLTVTQILALRRWLSALLVLIKRNVLPLYLGSLKAGPLEDRTRKHTKSLKLFQTHETRVNNQSSS